MLPATAPKHARPLRPRMGGRFLGEPALADAGFAGDCEQASATGCRGINSGADFGQFAPPADEGLSAAFGVQVAHLH